MDITVIDATGSKTQNATIPATRPPAASWPSWCR